MTRFAAVVVSLIMTLLLMGCSGSDTVEAPKPLAVNDVKSVSAGDDKPGTSDTKSEVAPLVAPTVEATGEVAKSEPLGEPKSQPRDEVKLQNASEAKSDVRNKQGLEALIAATEPAIVRIDVSTREGSSLGSGFVIDETGIVVTNHHVIDGATSAKAIFADGTSVRVIGVLGTDPKRDIAILKIQKPEKKLLSLKRQTTRPQKGLSVVAFGAPRGLSFSASEGIVSAVRTAAELVDFGKPLDGEWIQTTTPISPGNSGGPLVNLSGEVVGINTFYIVKGQNLNFVVSAADIERIYEQAKDSNPLPLAMNVNAGKDNDRKEIRSLKIPPPFKYQERYQVESKKGKFDTLRRISLGPISFPSQSLDSGRFYLTLYVTDDERVLDNANLWVLSVSADWVFRDHRRLKFLIDGELTNLGEMERDAEVKTEDGRVFCIERLDASIPLTLLLKIANSQTSETSDFVVGTHEGYLRKDAARDLLSRLPATKTVSGIALEIDDQIAAEHRRIAESRKASQAAATAKAEKELAEAEEKKAQGSLTFAKKYVSDGKTKLARQTLEGLIKRYPQTSARREADELLQGLSD